MILVNIALDRQCLLKLPGIKFNKNPVSGYVERRTDDMAKLMGEFLQLFVANAPRIRQA
jgi:hypothetical protein